MNGHHSRRSYPPPWLSWAIGILAVSLVLAVIGLVLKWSGALS